ncbi:MAG TPA: hypothetical protein VMR28_00105 [Candidatus Saccharimonadales bacterium]|nr:hypothetical protein [Candidatus Saccharimonadales bacterium]
MDDKEAKAILAAFHIERGPDEWRGVQEIARQLLETGHSVPPEGDIQLRVADRRPLGSTAVEGAELLPDIDV